MAKNPHLTQDKLNLLAQIPDEVIERIDHWNHAIQSYFWIVWWLKCKKTSQSLISRYI